MEDINKNNLGIIVNKITDEWRMDVLDYYYGDYEFDVMNRASVYNIISPEDEINMAESIREYMLEKHNYEGKVDEEIDFDDLQNPLLSSMYFGNIIKENHANVSHLLELSGKIMPYVSSSSQLFDSSFACFKDMVQECENEEDFNKGLAKIHGGALVECWRDHFTKFCQQNNLETYGYFVNYVNEYHLVNVEDKLPNKVGKFDVQLVSQQNYSDVNERFRRIYARSGIDFNNCEFYESKTFGTNDKSELCIGGEKGLIAYSNYIGGWGIYNGEYFMYGTTPDNVDMNELSKFFDKEELDKVINSDDDVKPLVSEFGVGDELNFIGSVVGYYQELFNKNMLKTDNLNDEFLTQLEQNKNQIENDEPNAKKKVKM